MFIGVSCFGELRAHVVNAQLGAGSVVVPQPWASGLKAFSREASTKTPGALNLRLMDKILVYSLLWVMQDFVHQPYHSGLKDQNGVLESSIL